DIGRFDVAMDDALLMRMLNRLAHRKKELKTLSNAKTMMVAVLCNRNAIHELHDEVWVSPLGYVGIQDVSDIGMVHHGDGLALIIESRDDLAGVHAALNDFQCHAAVDRIGLLC